VVWHHSLPLMNSFNKTEAAVFSCKLCFLRAFPFISLMLSSDKVNSYICTVTYHQLNFIMWCLARGLCSASSLLSFLQKIWWSKLTPPRLSQFYIELYKENMKRLLLLSHTYGNLNTLNKNDPGSPTKIV